MDRQQVIDIDKQHYLPVFGRLPIVLDHGEGCYVYDVDGKKYLDFLAGIAVNALGYNNKHIVSEISKQAAKLMHCSNLFYTEPCSKLVDRLVKISKFDRVFICNSGAEANEGALKLARKYGSKISPKKTKIITAMHSFHGRTLATLTATGQPKYQEGYNPLPADFEYVDFGDVQSIEKAMSDDVCAVLLEPIQGEGGVHEAPAGYLQAVRDLCDKHQAVLIFDEIQTGICRTAKWFAFEYDNVRPDIVTLAKGLGGGFPIGAFLTIEKIAQAFSAGDHGTTFGGNPLACSAANATLDQLIAKKIIENTEKIGNYFKTNLNKLKDKYPTLITEVRGRGLLLGMQLTKPGSDIVSACLKEGLIINCTAVNVLRFVPPLIVSVDEIDEAIEVLDKVLQQQ